MSQEFLEASTTNKPKTSGRGLGYFLAFCFAFGAFLSGIQIGQGIIGDQQVAGLFSLFTVAKEEPTTEPDMKEFWKVWELLDEKFAIGSTTSSVTAEKKSKELLKDWLVLTAIRTQFTFHRPMLKNLMKISPETSVVWGWRLA